MFCSLTDLKNQFTCNWKQLTLLFILFCICLINRSAVKGAWWKAVKGCCSYTAQKSNSQLQCTSLVIFSIYNVYGISVFVKKLHGNSKQHYRDMGMAGNDIAITDHHWVPVDSEKTQFFRPLFQLHIHKTLNKC